MRKQTKNGWFPDWETDRFFMPGVVYFVHGGDAVTVYVDLLFAVHSGEPVVKRLDKNHRVQRADTMVLVLFGSVG